VGCILAAVEPHGRKIVSFAQDEAEPVIYRPRNRVRTSRSMAAPANGALAY
jgi:hypothetical protein